MSTIVRSTCLGAGLAGTLLCNRRSKWAIVPVCPSRICRKGDVQSIQCQEGEYKGMLHKDVLEYVGSEHGALVEKLVELARLQVIELGESDKALKTIDAAILVTPHAKRSSLQERVWMDGIASFYSGKWDRCARHFETEMAVNAVDVEVPVWRWLCDARNPNLGKTKARGRLIECGHDVRAPFPEIWQMFKGTHSTTEEAVAAVLQAADQAGTEDSKMWGHFYVGLYLEALDRHSDARAHFLAAAETRSCNNIAMLARTHFRKVVQREEKETWAALSQQVKPFLKMQGFHAGGTTGRTTPEGPAGYQAQQY